MSADREVSISAGNVRQRVLDLTAWLIGEARLIGETGRLDQTIVERLCGAGLPIVRFTTGVPSLHPHVDSFSTLWEVRKGLTFRQYRAEHAPAEPLANSPIFVAYNGTSTRNRLTGPREEDAYEILDELRAQGLTDYVVLALPFSDGSHKAMSFATDRDDGFSDSEVAVLEGLRTPLAAAIEVRYLRHLAGTLMETYVGPVAGRKVLEGAIRRGSQETIRAVIWFCDLKGFTALSESVGGQALIDTLNSYFDVMTGAIEAEGGEVLKFIGDAVLAIFQPGEGSDRAAAERALNAAPGAVAAFGALNLERHSQGKFVIDCGIALHFGDVLYGNVGGRNRLDFTVIGPAVNRASRIESLTRQLDRPLLVSETFAELHGGAFDRIGCFALKGIAGEHTIMAPPLDVHRRPM